MHTKTIQKTQKAYIKTYEEDVKIYEDIENSQGQFFFFLKTLVHIEVFVLYLSMYLLRAPMFLMAGVKLNANPAPILPILKDSNNRNRRPLLLVPKTIHIYIYIYIHKLGCNPK